MYQRVNRYKQTPVNRSHRGSAFTLVEVLVTLTIGALLVVSVVSSTRALSRTRNNVDIRVERSSSARHAMESIVTALRNVRRDPIQDSPVLVGHSGGRGAGRDAIDLQVISDRRCRQDGAESDQYEVSFYLWQRTGQRWPTLMCRRDHALDEYPDEGGIATVVAEGIVALSFDYYTLDEHWVSEWSELEPQPPKAVRLTVEAVADEPMNLSARPSTALLSTVVSIHANEPDENPQRRRDSGKPEGKPGEQTGNSPGVTRQ